MFSSTLPQRFNILILLIYVFCCRIAASTPTSKRNLALHHRDFGRTQLRSNTSTSYDKSDPDSATQPCCVRSAMWSVPIIDYKDCLVSVDKFEEDTRPYGQQLFEFLAPDIVPEEGSQLQHIRTPIKWVHGASNLFLPNSHT